MSSNKKDNNGWILCPSKRFPGKFYYFNVVNGQTAWSLNDADHTLRKDSVLQNADKSHSYPEPLSPPADYQTANFGPIRRTVSNIPRQNLPNIPPMFVPNIPPMFGQATFPTYISNVDPYMQNMIWTPIQLPMFAKPRQDQITQTWESEREIFVQASSIPLSKRFINYDEPKTSFFSPMADCSQNKKQSISTSYSFDSLHDKPMTSHVFGQTKQSHNKYDQSKCNMTSIFCNDDPNKSMNYSQIFDPKARFQSDNLIKNVVRQRTQSEFDKNNDNIDDNQNYGMPSKQMFEQTYWSTNTKDNIENVVRRQRSQSESDSFIFGKPNNFDNPISTVTTMNKAHNASQQNTVTSKTDDQMKRSFVLRNPVLIQNNKVQNTSSQLKSTGQIEKEVRKESLWGKQDGNFMDENKKGHSIDNHDRNKNGKPNGDLLEKLDKEDLRYILEIKRKKSAEGNKVKTQKVNNKQIETPKKRVTFDLDSETSVEELQECNGNQTQYVNIHTMRQLTDHIADYWYIVVDTNVLLEDFEFIDKFVQLDGNCKLLIPHAVQSAIESFCYGDCRGQQRVIVARQLIRKLAAPPPHIVVQPIENEDEDFTNLSILGRILNCCLQMTEQNDHAVLITNDSILYEKARFLKIHCFKLKEVKDGASQPVHIPEPIKITLKNETKNLFLQKDFDTTWKTPIDTYNKSTKDNTQQSYDIQTDIPVTMDASTSPINFEATIPKKNGKSNEYLNFDYDSNSETTNISKTMKKLFIKDNNSNFVMQKSTTKNASKVTDKEFNSFAFQIKNKNTLQSQNVKSNQSQNLTEHESNYLQNSKDKSINQQIKKKESVFREPNDPLKYLKFQIQNKMPHNENVTKKKNVRFLIQTNEKEIQSLPDSNNNRRLRQEKIRSSIQEELNHRFKVTSTFMGENIRSNMEEWICTFVQVMENALSNLLQDSNLPSLSLPPPWTLHEAITCIKQVYSELLYVCEVADELSLLLFNYSNKQGQLKRNMKPEEFMRIFGCGLTLIEHLQATKHMPEDIIEAQQILGEVLLTLQNGKEDIDLVRSPLLTRSDDEEDNPERQNFVKKSSEVWQYLKKHFPVWQLTVEYNPTLCDDEVITQNNNTKIFRTCGRNASLLTINKTKNMTMNVKENPTTNQTKNITMNAKEIPNTDKFRSMTKNAKENLKDHKENISQSADNNNTEINISPNTLSSEKTVKLYEMYDAPKRVSDVNTPIAKNNRDKDISYLIKQKENKENISQDPTESTEKLYEEPKIVRIFDASTPFPTKKSTNDTNKGLILLSPKHGNTFGTQEETAGPKVVRNIKLIDAFEKKLQFKVDMDELNYSVMEETLSTVSNTSQYLVDENNDKVSLNDQNNDKVDQNNDRSNVLPDDENLLNNQKVDVDNGESNISSNGSFIDDRNNETNQNNDSLKPNDSSTNDSGFVNENDTYMLVQTFLCELSVSMKLIYKFIEDSMKEFRNKDLQSEKRKKILDKATTAHGHLTGIIYKLQCIVQREADSVTPLKEIILKADVSVVSDKRMMRYRQVVIKCLEQAQMLEGALRLLLSIADGNYDVAFCSNSALYFNIFE